MNEKEGAKKRGFGSISERSSIFLLHKYMYIFVSNERINRGRVGVSKMRKTIVMQRCPSGAGRIG